jgi:SAM-dependent methyltransferase
MSIVDKFGHVSNDEWGQLLQRSVKEPFIDGVEFPRFPHSSVQLGFNGASDEEGMYRAHALWLYAEGYCRAYGNPLRLSSKALDIGCGWGRITRTFARDIAPENIHGVDIDPSAITICQYLGVPGQFALTQPGAPLPFADNFFDVITANSVFTHLPESLTMALLAEINRVTKPRGIVVFTVEDESFYNYLDTPGIENTGARWSLLSRYVDQADALRERTAAGEYVYLVTNNEGVRTSDVYGDAIIPLSWLQHNCWRLFNFVRYDSARAPIYQAVVVGRKEV